MPGQGVGAIPQPSARPPPPPGWKGQILYVCSGKSCVCERELLAVEVQPGTGLPSLGTAEREQSLAAWPEWAFRAPVPFAFDCFGLLFSGKVAAAPVALLSSGLAGELASCPESSASSFQSGQYAKIIFGSHILSWDGEAISCRQELQG